MYTCVLGRHPLSAPRPVPQIRKYCLLACLFACALESDRRIRLQARASIGNLSKVVRLTDARLVLDRNKEKVDRYVCKYMASERKKIMLQMQVVNRIGHRGIRVGI
jgi:hypothetical protein